MNPLLLLGGLVLIGWALKAPSSGAGVAPGVTLGPVPSLSDAGETEALLAVTQLQAGATRVPLTNDAATVLVTSGGANLVYPTTGGGYVARATAPPAGQQDSPLPIGAIGGVIATGGAMGSDFFNWQAGTNVFGAVGGLAGIWSGIQAGNPFVAAGGSARVGAAVADYLGAADVAGVLGTAGGPLSIGSGILSLAEGDIRGISSIISGIGSTASGVASLIEATAATTLIEGSVFAEGVVGGTLLTAVPILAGIAAYATIIGVPLSIGLNNYFSKEAERVRRQTIESGDIRRGYAEAIPNIALAVSVARSLGQVSSLPPAAQVEALSEALDLLLTGWQDLGDVSRFISTRGQGGAASTLGPLDTSDAERIAAEATPDIAIGLLRVQDALAQRGVALPQERVGPFSMADIVAVMNQTRAFAGANDFGPFSQLTPAEMRTVAAGTMEAFYRTIFRRENILFDLSPMGQRLAALPTIAAPTDASDARLAAVLAAEIADRTRLLDAEAAAIFRTTPDSWLDPSYGTTEMGGQGILYAPPRPVNNIVYLAPYTVGGMPALAQRLADVLEHPTWGPTIAPDAIAASYGDPSSP